MYDTYVVTISEILTTAFFSICSALFYVNPCLFLRKYLMRLILNFMQLRKRLLASGGTCFSEVQIHA